MNPITEKEYVKIGMHLSVRKVDQTHAEWQTFGKPENKRHVYGSN